MLDPIHDTDIQDDIDADDLPVGERTYYLAGPMTDIPQFNFPAFDEAAKRLRRVPGLHIVSPAELDDPETRRAALASLDGRAGSGAVNGETWGDFLARDVKLVGDEVDGVIVMEEWFNTADGRFVNWRHSRGARLEVFVARLTGKPVFGYDSGREFEPLRRLPRWEINDALEVGYQADDETKPQADATFPDTDRVMLPVYSEPSVEKLLVGEEVMVTDEETGGSKGQKLPRLGAIDSLALLELAKVAGMGAMKYSRFNYLRGLPWSSCIDAADRHELLFLSGVARDEESGLLHTAHAAWQMLALTSFQLRGVGTDDRAPAFDPEALRRSSDA